MMRRTPLRRKTPLKRTWIKKTPKWKSTSVGAKPMKKRSSKRSSDERKYSAAHSSFCSSWPVCPVTGGTTTQIHHSAKREGKWLLWERYWIAVSLEGHAWIEANKKEAEKYGLMVRINVPFQTHFNSLFPGLKLGDYDTQIPTFYDDNHNLPLVNEKNQPIYGPETA